MKNPPPLEAFVELIRTKDRRVGLRLLYKRYNIHGVYARRRVRAAWDALSLAMPDVYQPTEPGMYVVRQRQRIIAEIERARKRRKSRKEREYASRKRKTEAALCAIGVQSASRLGQESGHPENEQGQTQTFYETQVERITHECNLPGQSGDSAAGAGAGAPDSQTI